MLSNMTILQLQLSALFTKFQGKKVIDPAHLFAFETLQVIKKTKQNNKKRRKKQTKNLKQTKSK